MNSKLFIPDGLWSGLFLECEEQRVNGESVQVPIFTRDNVVVLIKWLWRLDLEDDEPLVCVEVTDATAGADHAFRHHVLRVPPDVHTGLNLPPQPGSHVDRDVVGNLPGLLATGYKQYGGQSQ